MSAESVQPELPLNGGDASIRLGQGLPRGGGVAQHGRSGRGQPSGGGAEPDAAAGEDKMRVGDQYYGPLSERDKAAGKTSLLTVRKVSKRKATMIANLGFGTATVTIWRDRLREELADPDSGWEKVEE